MHMLFTSGFIRIYYSGVTSCMTSRVVIRPVQKTNQHLYNNLAGPIRTLPHFKGSPFAWCSGWTMFKISLKIIIYACLQTMYRQGLSAAEFVCVRFNSIVYSLVKLSNCARHIMIQMLISFLHRSDDHSAGHTRCHTWVIYPNETRCK